MGHIGLPHQRRGVAVLEGRKYVRPGGNGYSRSCAFSMCLAPTCLVRLG